MRPSDRRKSAYVLLVLVGLAVSALIHSRVRLVRADADAVERAVLLFVAMVHTIVHCAFNAVVRCRTCHLF